MRALHTPDLRLCMTGVAGLTRPDAATEAAKSYAIAMADTVLVPEGDTGGELLTGVAPRGWSDNAFEVAVSASNSSSASLPSACDVMRLYQMDAEIKWSVRQSQSA